MATPMTPKASEPVKTPSPCVKQGKKSLASKLEDKFYALWRFLGGPELKREHVHIPNRRFRLDFVHEPTGTGIEVQGAVYGGKKCPYCGERKRFGHSSGTGITRDAQKNNLGIVHGWAVFVVTEMLMREPKEILEMIHYIERKQKFLQDKIP